MQFGFMLFLLRGNLTKNNNNNSYEEDTGQIFMPQCRAGAR